MLYYIYIGNNKTAINHLNTITDGMFVSVSSVNKAVKIINGIRERYNTSILYEQTNTEKDCIDISYLHKKFPRVYIILITGKLQTEHRKAYLQAGVSNTLPLQADKESIQRMSQFLQIRQQHKMQEFSETRRKALNTFHLPLWKRTFDVLFSLSALVILSPLLIGTAIAIRLESKGKEVTTGGQQLPDIQFSEVPFHVHQCGQTVERAQRPQPVSNGRRSGGGHP